MDRLPLETQKEIILDQRSQVIAELRIELTKCLSQPNSLALTVICNDLMGRLTTLTGLLWGLNLAQGEVPV